MASLRLTRRQFGAGFVATTLASASLPTTVVTAATVGTDDEDWLIAECMEDLVGQHEACSATEEMYGVRSYGYAMWQSNYAELVQAGDDIRALVTADTSSNRQILARARELMPPPCERARTYWSPILGLSPRFERSSKQYYGLRAERIDAGGDPTSNWFPRWVGAVSKILDCRTSTQGDRELQRRVLQIYGCDDMLDMPYVRTTRRRPAFQEDWPKRCGALPCTECDRWLS